MPAHFDTLSVAINQAEKIDANAYEKAGIDALNAAVSAAKTVYANPKSTEADTTKAKNDLENAIKALVKKQSQAAGTGANTSQTANTDNIQKVTPATNNTQNKASVGTVITVGNLKYTITSSDKLTVSVKAIVKNKASVKIPKKMNENDTVDGLSFHITGRGQVVVKGTDGNYINTDLDVKIKIGKTEAQNEITVNEGQLTNDNIKIEKLDNDSSALITT